MKTEFTALIASVILSAQAQVVTEDFESFVLPASSFYSDTTSKPFKSDYAVFTYEWTGGQYPFWSGGFSYTNRHDSVTSGFTNLYGVKAFSGYNGSDKYVVGQQGGIIRMRYPMTTVLGFRYTNTTYAYKSMKYGDAFSRRFGDTTGTGSGTTIPQGSYPDYFKIVLRAFSNGVLKNDSVEIYLADFRSQNNSQDYIVNDWLYANTNVLGTADSLRFDLRSSDMGQWGMNTPAFFAIDNFMTVNSLISGYAEHSEEHIAVYPQPCSDMVQVNCAGEFAYSLRCMDGRVLDAGTGRDQLGLQMLNYPAGLYLLTVNQSEQTTTIKIIKQ